MFEVGASRQTFAGMNLKLAALVAFLGWRGDS